MPPSFLDETNFCSILLGETPGFVEITKDHLKKNAIYSAFVVAGETATIMHVSEAQRQAGEWERFIVN